MGKRLFIKRLVTLTLVAALAFTASLTIATAPASAQPDKAALTREDNQGVAWVTLTFLNPLKGLDDKELVFKVGMGSHSVDLDGYDFAEVLVLRDDKRNIYKALKVEGLKGGGHHRGGQVVFPGLREDGTSILQNAEYFEVLATGVADVPERVLRWNLPIK